MRFVIATILFLHVSSCVSTTDGDVELATPSIDDEAYLKTYDTWTQDVQVYHHFDKIYFLTVTKLSADFLKNFRERYQRIYHQDPAALQDTQNHTAFFISIEGPDTEQLDLADRNQWSILLKDKDLKSPPMIIRQLQQKVRWQPFFPSINHWTQEYLVMFEHKTLDTEHLVASPQVQLTLANAQASVILNWDAVQRK